MTITANSQMFTILVLVLIGVCGVLLIGTINLTLSVHRLKAKYKTFMKGNDGVSLEKLFVNRFKTIEHLEDQVEQDHKLQDAMLNTQMKTLTKYGIVKYDAFDDVGGKMSFALANLDKSNTGYILNAIHSRDNCFLYLKEIVNGESYIMLSDEEVKALRIAVNGGMDLEGED